MSYTWRMQILANDAKRVYKETQEKFVPYPGMALRGYMGELEDEVKITAVVWDASMGEFRVALSWMGLEVPDSKALAPSGWKKIVPGA